MATTPKKATLTAPKTAACCSGPAGADDSAAVVRRESASATAAADWTVSPAAEDQKNKAAATVATLIRPEPSSNAAAKGINRSHFCFLNAIINCLFYLFFSSFRVPMILFSSSVEMSCFVLVYVRICACGVH